MRRVLCPKRARRFCDDLQRDRVERRAVDRRNSAPRVHRYDARRDPLENRLDVAPPAFHLDVFALENERRKKAKDRLAGSVDDDVAIHELGGNAFRQICRVEFSAQHQPDAPNVHDAFVTRREF